MHLLSSAKLQTMEEAFEVKRQHIDFFLKALIRVPGGSEKSHGLVLVSGINSYNTFE